MLADRLEETKMKNENISLELNALLLQHDFHNWFKYIIVFKPLYRWRGNSSVIVFDGKSSVKCDDDPLAELSEKCQETVLLISA